MIQMIMRKVVLSMVLPVIFLQCAKGDPSVPETPDPIDDYEKVTVQIDQGQTYQVIDGFGFFGAHDVWWGNAADMWNDAWGEKIITDLGISIWRNEIYPPAIPQAPQDADWNKQLPVVRGLKAKADQHGVPLKFVATVWSPPADLKWAAQMAWAGDTEASRWEDPDVTTKNGGTLNPGKYPDYAEWLNSHIRLYEEEGIELYALSLQNEPAFSQYFNSCQYTVAWYNDLLINVVPDIKSASPGIKIFGSENMLLTEGKDENWRWFYHSGIKDNAGATANLDILAVHGYNDGVLPTSGSELVKMWINHSEQFSMPMDKKVWMSETSGYTESWETEDGKPGALGLGLDIMTALNYGNISAWIWWQGSQSDGIGEYNLMKGITPGNKYFVSKHYYRYIRPGAVRVHATVSSEEGDLFTTAFKNDDKGTFTIVIVNAGEPRAVSIEGNNLPDEFVMYRTNASGSEKCSLIETIKSVNNHSFVLPENTIVTLQAGGDPL
ncbi:O-Glycosyl hydrolase [Porphyromonadaceae bacterium KH3R12]|nr:O-Glycosyl hydrolase [Porphyromonadaceae bacterium KH3R12]